MTNNLIVTVDIDWACEEAIRETIDFLRSQNIFPTIFTTHRSAVVESYMQELEVGLHPYFGLNSSHGSTIDEVVKHIMNLPHNFLGFRCHRFAICNSSRQAMVEAGMLISSNICTDLENVSPFIDRFGILEVPIFLEDGGYLWRKHPLEMNQKLQNSCLNHGTKVITIHPMHFALNTPNFKYMYDIKQSFGREEWTNMSKSTLEQLRWNGKGIRDLILELLALMPIKLPLGSLLIGR